MRTVERPPAVTGLRTRPGRLIGVDAARGVALLGMMAVHVLSAVDPDGSTSTAYLIASGRSAAAFAVLAGVGLALASGGPRPPSGQRWLGFSAGLVVRALLIGAIGLGLGYADSGVAVILAYYGLIFVVAIPLLRLGPAALAGLGLVTAVVVPLVSQLVRDELADPRRTNPTFGTLLDNPAQLLVELSVTGYYPVLTWTVYLCAGLAVGRLPLHSSRVAAALLAGGAALAVAASAASSVLLDTFGGRDRILDTVRSDFDPARLDRGWFGTTPETTLWWLALDSPHSSTPFDMLHTTGTALALLGATLLLARVASALLVPLAAAGGMTLTLYSVHVLWLSTSWLPEDRTDSYLLQVGAALLVAVLWLGRFRRGPLEALIAVFAGAAARAVTSSSR